MGKKRQVEIERFRERGPGAVSCIVCKKMFVLRFNGGELDGQACCNYFYSLEYAVEPDLVITRWEDVPDGEEV